MQKRALRIWFVSLVLTVEAYLIQDGMVFPVSASAPNAFHYTKVPLDKFEARVKAAVKKNIDTA